MPSFEVDLPIIDFDLYFSFKVEKELIPTKKLARKVPKYLRKAAIRGRRYWREEAGRRLKTSRIRYQRSLGYKEGYADSFAITLGEAGTIAENKLAVAVEAGMPPFNLAKAAGRTRNVPLNVNGYIHPFKAKVFRKRSVNAPPGVWDHPGLPAANIADAVVKELTERIIPEEFAKMLEEL